MRCEYSETNKNIEFHRPLHHPPHARLCAVGFMNINQIFSLSLSPSPICRPLICFDKSRTLLLKILGTQRISAIVTSLERELLLLLLLLIEYSLNDFFVRASINSKCSSGRRTTLDGSSIALTLLGVNA
jgi:hypothetical protein